ncbi:Uncharacterised protein [Klebsiella pneumoniae]|uniref:Uncharacterized protein n=1 Tax=Klebsiella pneumoniae TaxID=573 RepID=A0A377VDA9_KLEPN|nr:Uncharacterised protein [Klebsiella pneumoniae]
MMPKLTNEVVIQEYNHPSIPLLNDLVCRLRLYRKYFQVSQIPTHHHLETLENVVVEQFRLRGEQLLHQALFVGLKGAELLDFCCDQSIKRRQAVGDFLLFCMAWYWNRHAIKSFLTDIEQSIAPCSACDVLSQLDAVRIPLKALAIKAILVSIFQAKADKNIRCCNFTPTLKIVYATLWELERVPLVINKVTIHALRYI